MLIKEIYFPINNSRIDILDYCLQIMASIVTYHFCSHILKKANCFLKQNGRQSGFYAQSLVDEEVTVH